MGTVKAEAADSGKELRAAVNATAPPFAFMENGKLVGFEVDLHAEVAKRMGKQLVMTNIPFAGLAPGLQAKKWDAAGNTWINKERLVMMDFSDPWVDAQLAFVTRKNDAITSPEQLKGKTVGAEAGTAEQRWLDANQEKYGLYTCLLYTSAPDVGVAPDELGQPAHHDAVEHAGVEMCIRDRFEGVSAGIAPV